MFSQGWQVSPRSHGVVSAFDVMIPMSDGVHICAQVFRPDGPGEFPALLGVHAYDAEMQHTPSRPQAVQGRNAQAEAGDPRFYARRGYLTKKLPQDALFDPGPVERALKILGVQKK